MAKSTPTQREPLRLLSYGQSVSTPIAVVAVSGLTISVVSLLLQILNYGATSRLAHKDPPSLVQLADGNVITVAPLGPRDRTPETIKKFTSDVLVTMFNWDGVLNSSTTTTPVPDPGITIKLERKPGKVTTSAWQAAFALSEENNFRSEFLKKLAELTPPGVFNGDVQVSLVIRYVGEPKKIGENQWKIDVVATLITFKKDDNAGSGIPFNKTIYLSAVSTPQTTPSDTPNLAKAIYEIRKVGLEITGITDLERPNL